MAANPAAGDPAVNTKTVLSAANDSLSIEDEDRLVLTAAQTTLVLTSGDFRLSSETNFSTERLVVYAETITIASSVNALGRQIELHCTRFNIVMTSPDAKIDINVSGAAGTEHAKIEQSEDAVQTATSGQPGGSLIIHVHNLPFAKRSQSPSDLQNPPVDSVWPLAVRVWANGGNAASGRVEMKDAIPRWVQGFGGTSGCVQLYYSNELIRFAESMNALSVKSQSAAEWLRNISGNLVSSIQDELTDAGFLNDEFTKLQAAIETANKALADKIDSDDTVLKELQRTALEFHHEYKMLLERCAEAFEGRAEAKAGIGSIKTEKPSVDWKITTRVLSHVGDHDGELDVPVSLVHPDQCQMILRQADKRYFANDGSDVLSLYRLLLERLSFVPAMRQAKPGSCNLVSSFERMETELRLGIAARETLGAIHSSASQRLTQILYGLDLFGYQPNWVPLLTADYYRERIESRIAWLAQVQDSYKNFLKSSASATARESLLTDAAAASNARTKALDAELEDAKVLLTSSEASIVLHSDAVKKKRVVLQDKMKGISVSGAHCPTVSQWLQLAGSLAYAGVAAYVGGPVGWASAVSSATMGIGNFATSTLTEVTTPEGVTIKKDYITSQVTRLQDLIKTFETGTKTETSGFVSAEVDTHKLIATEEQVREFLNQFRNVISGAAKDDVVTAFKEYVNASTKRSTFVAQYNHAASVLLAGPQRRADLAAQGAAIGGSLISVNPRLSSICAFYQTLRDDTNFAVLRALNEFGRAIRFLGLEDPDSSLTFAKPEFITTVDALGKHRDDLMERYDKCNKRFAQSGLNIWPKQNEEGIFVQLTDGELALLKAGVQNGRGERQYSVELHGLETPMSRLDPEHEDPFESKADVRLTQFRVWLPGARLSLKDKGASGPKKPLAPADLDNLRLMVYITQDGYETVVDQQGNPHTFKHDGKDFQFEYTPNKVKTRADCVDKNMFGQQILCHNLSSTPVGPYAAWTIKLQPSSNQILDLTDVEEAWVEFGGSHVALSPKFYDFREKWRREHSTGMST